jgi:hypothetical protein
MRRKVPRIGEKIICFAKLGRTFEKKLNAGTYHPFGEVPVCIQPLTVFNWGGAVCVNFRLSLDFHAP